MAGKTADDCTGPVACGCRGRGEKEVEVVQSWQSRVLLVPELATKSHVGHEETKMELMGSCFGHATLERRSLPACQICLET